MRRLKLAVAMVGFGILGITVYAMAPVPSGDLFNFMPKPSALGKYKGSGCGVSSETRASSTVFYEGVHLTVSDEKLLEQEMQREGFTRSVASGGYRYQKRHGGWMPVTSTVYVGKKGIIRSAVRRKWPG